MKKLTTILLFVAAFSLSAQVFEDQALKRLVKRGADHIYNADPDSAYFYINQIGEKLPEHPVVPLMTAMTMLWSNIPTITEELFLQMQDQLLYAIELAEIRDPDLDDPEMVFFAMASHGLLAEYYADQDYNLRAVGEANKAYGLMKKGFKIVDTHSEFLFTTGLYNYFREKYPEKHPIYKPLLWFFRSGDIELGLKQLEEACEVAVLSQVEAYVYLSYIYLRYEYKPKKAQEYLGTIIEKYPNNFYAKGKYLESLANPQDFEKAPIEIIYSLMHHENLYYKLAGYVFLGYYEEMIIGSNEKAEFAYRQGLLYGDEITHHGEYFKGLGYLGLGRILALKGKKEEAREKLNLAIKFAETEQIRRDARELLAGL
ncbi:MAG: hypothetical protein ABJP45_13700 [Cyclobacteriaceae bacterium]